MKIWGLKSNISLVALAAASVYFVAPAAHAQSVSATKLQAELNSLQAQINEVKAQQAQLQAQAAQQAEVAKEQALVAKQLAASAKNSWFAGGKGGYFPDFVSTDGKSEATLYGQITVDAGVGTIPGTHGYNGATNLRRLELGLKGVYQQNFPYKIQFDLTSNSTPLKGVLDAYVGYQFKSGSVTNVFLAGNQFAPFGFHTGSPNTLFLEDSIGINTFRQGRILGITGRDYNKNFNIWYGLQTTGDGVQPGGTTGNVINTGKTFVHQQYNLAVDPAWNVINTPGHLLSLRSSFQYTRYNADKAGATANEPSFGTTPDLNLYGFKFIGTLALPIQSALVIAPRADFEYKGLTMAAEYFDVTTQSNDYVAIKGPNPGVAVTYTTGRHFAPSFSAWDVEAQYFLTDDHLPYSDSDGNYVGVKVRHPVTDGGPGAVQLTARMDEVNLQSAKYGVHGGNESDLTLGVNWWPVNDIRVMANYVHMFPIGGASNPPGAAGTFAAAPPGSGGKATSRGQQMNAFVVRLNFIY